MEEEEIRGLLIPSAYSLGASSRPMFAKKCSPPPLADQPFAEQEQLPADCLLLSAVVAQSLPGSLSAESIDCNEEHCTSTWQEQSYCEPLHPEPTLGEPSFVQKLPVPPSAPRGTRRPGRAFESSIQTCTKEDSSFVSKGLAPQPPSAPRTSQGPGRRQQRSAAAAAACAAPKQGDADEAPVTVAVQPAQQQIQAQQQLMPVLVPPRASSLLCRPESRQSLAGGSARHRGSSARTAMEMDLEGDVTAPTAMTGQPAPPVAASTTSLHKMYKVSVDAGGAGGISYDSKSPRFLPSINQKGRNLLPASGTAANWSLGPEETWRFHAVA